MRLGLIYHQCKFKDIALTRLARWYDEALACPGRPVGRALELCGRFKEKGEFIQAWGDFSSWLVMVL